MSPGLDFSASRIDEPGSYEPAPGESIPDERSDRRDVGSEWANLKDTDE